jgi:AraC-like DNA-binding protein
VAFEVGYDDVSSFISAFKAATGETPAPDFK